MAPVQTGMATVEVGGVQLDVVSWGVRPKATLADLSGDPVCCALLMRWSKRPWDDACPGAIADRMEEIGLGEEAHFLRLVTAAGNYGVGKPEEFRSKNRTTRRALLSRWREMLSAWFGNWVVPLCERAQTDTPAEAWDGIPF